MSGSTGQGRPGTNEIERLGRQFQTVSNEKNAVAVRDTYPVFGEHVAGWPGGWIDPTKKPPGDIFASLILQVGPNSPGQLDADKVAAVMTALKNEHCTVFLGGVQLDTTSGRSGYLLYGFQGCGGVDMPGPGPCIAYFREELGGTVATVKRVVAQAQVVPDGRVRYVDRSKLPSLAQELLQKSGLDIMIVLTGQ